MFLFSIFFSLFLRYHGGHALPFCNTLNVTSLLGESAILTVSVSASAKPEPPRTLFSVTWACVLTVFICAWTSVHPNVPPQSQIGGLFARVKLMFWTIVAPELVLAWAVRQWFAAREIRNIYNQHRGNRPSKRWTMAHGHFLGMGGFTLVSDKIHQLEEPEQPGWMSTTADWDLYAEYVRQRELCQLGPLSFERFQDLVRDSSIVFPVITSGQIKDRSKGDGLSKLIAILETSWFITQCIARSFQGLALTKLELVTLAMASLNGITFAFWWSKPLGVQEPVNIYVPAGVAREVVDRKNEDPKEDQCHDIYVTAHGVIYNTQKELRHAVSFIFDPLRYSWEHNMIYTFGLYLIRLPYRLFFILTFPVFFLFPLGILFLLWAIKTKKVEKPQGVETFTTRLLRMLRYKLTHSIRQHFRRPYGSLWGIESGVYHKPRFFWNWFVVTPLEFLLLVLLLTVLSPLFTIFLIASFALSAVFEIVTTNTVPPGATHVHSFYAPRTKSDHYSRMIVFAIFGAIFGGIHCIGWNFIFPTHSERSMWRYTSLMLTVIPFVAAPIDCILANVKMDSMMFRLLLDIVMTVLLFVYVPARLSLIAQALALLREQPPTAFVAVDWTKYIPHLFN